MGSFKMTAGTIAVAVVLGGCAQEGREENVAATTSSSAVTPTPTPTPTSTTTTTAPGPVAFVEWAKQAELGDRDPSAASDEALLGIGTQSCEVMSSAPSFGWAVQEIVKETKNLGTTPGEMDAWLRQSVVNLCPQHKNLLP